MRGAVDAVRGRIGAVGAEGVVGAGDEGVRGSAQVGRGVQVAG